MKHFRLDKFNKVQLCIAAIAVVVVANIIASYVSIRIDFSKGRSYSLSASTKKILKNLDDVVTVKLFASSDLPVALTPLKTDVVDLVNEFKNAARGKIIFKQLDPKKDTDAQKEAQIAGIPQIQFNQIEQNKYAVSASYFGIEIVYGTKQDSIPQATNLDILEYDIASSIYKLTQKNEVKIGLYGMNQAVSQQSDQFYTLKTILGKQFTLENVDVASDSARFIDPSLKAVIVADTDNSQFSQHDIDEFNNYLSHNGQLILMVDGVYVSDQLQETDAKHNLFSFLNRYGIALHKNFVLSAQSEIANFTTSSGAFFTNYPYWIKTNNFSKQSSLFSTISLLTFPWAAQITTTSVPNVTTQLLAQSDKKSWIVDNTASLLPDKVPTPTKNTINSYPVIAEAVINGGGRLLVISSSRFAKEQFLAEGRDNMNFMLNVVNDYASGGALSGIRSRSVSIDLLRDVPESSKDPIKYSIIFILPALIGLYGAYRLIKRK